MKYSLRQVPGKSVSTTHQHFLEPNGKKRPVSKRVHEKKFVPVFMIPLGPKFKKMMKIKYLFKVIKTKKPLIYY